MQVTLFRRLRRFVWSLVLVALLLPTITGAQTTTETETVAVLKTNHGEMVFRFFAEDAPKTVAQIQRLIREGWYDGKRFYRVVSGHVIQAGDLEGANASTVPGEFGAHPHVRGAVGLARDSDPDSGTTEIYICHAPRPHLDGNYAVFGLLVDGFDVLDSIAATEVEEKWIGDEGKVAFHEPKTPVIIESAKLEERPVSR
ncbi:MAG: peptidylprolyl isomerase [Thermoanaerobaculia bacterium]|nr:peptidylprolyl isomerase [Thermoanaerobaculia bacterium]